MARDFKTTISALWAELQLAEPKFGPENEIVLTVDGIDLQFRDSPDERHLLVSVATGQLSQDPRTASRQVRTLMQASLAYLPSTSTCINISKAEDAVRRGGEPNLTVLVQAVYSYDQGRIADLVKIIQEVLRVQEIPRAELGEAAEPRRTRRPVEDATETVIFRP